MTSRFLIDWNLRRFECKQPTDLLIGRLKPAGISHALEPHDARWARTTSTHNITMRTKDLATKLEITKGNNQLELRSSKILVPITLPSNNQYTSIHSVQTRNASDVSNLNNGDTWRMANTRIPVKNKLKGTCSICDGEFQLQSDGNLYKHGHSSSSMSPVTGSIIQSQSSQNTNISNSQSSTIQNDKNRATVHNKENYRQSDDHSTFMHPSPHSRGIIKRIPKGSRFATASLLSKSLAEGFWWSWWSLQLAEIVQLCPCVSDQTNEGGSRNLTSLINN